MSGGEPSFLKASSGANGMSWYSMCEEDDLDVVQQDQSVYPQIVNPEVTRCDDSAFETDESYSKTPSFEEKRDSNFRPQASSSHSEGRSNFDKGKLYSYADESENWRNSGHGAWNERPWGQGRGRGRGGFSEERERGRRGLRGRGKGYYAAKNDRISYSNGLSRNYQHDNFANGSNGNREMHNSEGSDHREMTSRYYQEGDNDPQYRSKRNSRNDSKNIYRNDPYQTAPQQSGKSFNRSSEDQSYKPDQSPTWDLHKSEIGEDKKDSFCGGSENYDSFSNGSNINEKHIDSKVGEAEFSKQKSLDRNYRLRSNEGNYAGNEVHNDDYFHRNRNYHGDRSYRDNSYNHSHYDNSHGNNYRNDNYRGNNSHHDKSSSYGYNNRGNTYSNDYGEHYGYKRGNNFRSNNLYDNNHEDSYPRRGKIYREPLSPASKYSPRDLNNSNDATGPKNSVGRKETFSHREVATADPLNLQREGYAVTRGRHDDHIPEMGYREDNGHWEYSHSRRHSDFQQNETYGKKNDYPKSRSGSSVESNTPSSFGGGASRRKGFSPREQHHSELQQSERTELFGKNAFPNSRSGSSAEGNNASVSWGSEVDSPTEHQPLRQNHFHGNHQQWENEKSANDFRTSKTNSYTSSHTRSSSLRNEENSSKELNTYRSGYSPRGGYGQRGRYSPREPNREHYYAGTKQHSEFRQYEKNARVGNLFSRNRSRSSSFDNLIMSNKKEVIVSLPNEKIVGNRGGLDKREEGKMCLGNKLAAERKVKEMEEKQEQEKEGEEWENIAGTCEDMCPASERTLRERLQMISIYERLPENPNVLSQKLAVKAFSRTITAHKMSPSDIRPLRVLQFTMDHLMRFLDATWNSPPALFDFIADRTRAIRQELTIQRITGLPAIQIYAAIIRFHILATYSFCDYDIENKVENVYFDTYLNMEQMLKSLAAILSLFKLERQEKHSSLHSPADPSSLSPILSSLEAEFSAYYILLNMGKYGRQKPESIIQWLRSVERHVLKSSLVVFALDALKAYRLKNYAKFFKLVKKANFFQSCILHLHFPEMRACALEVYNTSFYSLHPIPLSKIFPLLELNSEKELMEVCAFYGLAVGHKPDNEKMDNVKCDDECSTPPEFLLVKKSRMCNRCQENPPNPRCASIDRKVPSSYYECIMNGALGIS